MHIGIAGPTSLRLALPDLDPDGLPVSYESPTVGCLAWELGQRGHDVTLFTTSTSVTERVILHSGRVRAVVVPRRSERVVRDLYSLERRALVAAIRELQPDVVEAQWTYEFAWAALDSGVPSAVVVRDDAVRVFALEPDLFRGVRLFMDRMTRVRAHHVIANSEYTRRTLSRRLTHNTPVIENFVGHDLRALAGEMKCDSDGRTVVTVVNGFSPLKNIERALQAFDRVRTCYPDVRYRLVGRDSQPGGPVARWAAERGLAGQLEFLGPLDHPSTLRAIHNASVLVHPSLEESFGNTLLEAMALGTPVVAGDASGNVPDLLGHGRFGMLVDVGSADAIADAIGQVLSQDELRNELVGAALTEANTRYSAQRCVTLHEQVLTKIARNG